MKRNIHLHSGGFRARAWLGTFLLWVPILWVSAAPPMVPDEVQGSARQRVDSGYTPGIVIGIVNPEGQTVFSYGVRSVQDPTSVDDHTLYEIGSVTKTFTAILLARMVETGDVAFTNRVTDLLPPGVNMPGNGGEMITLEQLASHRSGLPEAISNLPATVTDPANPFANYSAADMYAFLGGYSLTRAPGAAFEYSNLGIGLLGHVLALSQEQSYEALLKHHVIDPLGLADTAISLSPAQDTRRAPGHGGYVERPKFFMNDLEAAGGLFSTVHDLLTYVAHNLGLVPGGPLNTAMAESHLSRGSSGDPVYDIGLAWWLWNFGDVHTQHGGDTLGSTAFVAFRKSTRTGVVILSNARAHQYASVTDLGFRCLNDPFPLISVAVPAEVPISEMRHYVGRYVEGDTAIEIGLVNDALTLISGGVETTAYAQGERRFTLYEATGNVDLRFTLDGDNRTSGLRIAQGTVRLGLIRDRRPPWLDIRRDGVDVVIQLAGEGDQQYMLERSMSPENWQALEVRSVWDPPYREAADNVPHWYRAREAP